MPRPTPRRQLDAFVANLAQTGNLRLAADRCGLAVSGIHKRRTRDPAFAARCAEALAAFYSAPERGWGPSRTRSAMVEGARCTAQPLRTAAGDVVTVHTRRGPQYRRSPAGRLTQAGIAAFLNTLAATANVRLAANSVGVAPSSIYARRRHDHDFAGAMREALETGYGRIECALIEAAEQAVAAAIGGTASRAPAEPILTGTMTVHDAMALLVLHRRTCRQHWEHRAHEREPATWEEVEHYFKRKLRRQLSGRG
jgi:hypothetical protein